MAEIASEPAPRVGVQVSARSWKTAGLILVVVLALVAAGAIGWVVRGGGSAPTVSVAEAGRRYEALARVVDDRCLATSLLRDPVSSAGQCKAVLISMAAMLRGSSWPQGATQEAAALAAAIDKHVAFLDRVEAASPADRLQVAHEALQHSPVVKRAANGMRTALGLAIVSFHLL